MIPIYLLESFTEIKSNWYKDIFVSIMTNMQQYLVSKTSILCKLNHFFFNDLFCFWFISSFFITCFEINVQIYVSLLFSSEIGKQRTFHCKTSHKKKHISLLILCKIIQSTVQKHLSQRLHCQSEEFQSLAGFFLNVLKRRLLYSH